jgi:hypothetical protein
MTRLELVASCAGSNATALVDSPATISYICTSFASRLASRDTRINGTICIPEIGPIRLPCGNYYVALRRVSKAVRKHALTVLDDKIQAILAIFFVNPDDVRAILKRTYALLDGTLPLAILSHINYQFR